MYDTKPETPNPIKLAAVLASGIPTAAEQCLAARCIRDLSDQRNALLAACKAAVECVESTRYSHAEIEAMLDQCKAAIAAAEAAMSEHRRYRSEKKARAVMEGKELDEVDYGKPLTTPTDAELIGFLNDERQSAVAYLHYARASRYRDTADRLTALAAENEELASDRDRLEGMCAECSEKYERAKADNQRPREALKETNN